MLKLFCATFIMQRDSERFCVVEAKAPAISKPSKGKQADMCYLRILQIQGRNHRLSVLNRSHQLGCSFDLVLKLIALKFGFQMREKRKCGQIETNMQLFFKMCKERKNRLKLLKPNSPHSINVRWGGIACSKENLHCNVHSLHCWQLLRKRKWNTQQNLLESGSQ